MKKAFFSIAVCLSMAMITLSACKAGDGADSTRPHVLNEESGAGGKEGKDSDSGGLIKIGFTQVGSESDWRKANTESMKAELSEENGFELFYVDAQQKLDNQIKAVWEFISQGVDVICIAPVIESGWETVLGEAKEAGIPVIIVDRMIDVSDDSLYTCWVGSDFRQEGVDAANWLVEYMDEEGRGGEDVHIIVLQGTIDSTAEIGRTKGFGETIEKYDNFKILEQQTGEFTQAKGQEVMEEMLTKYDRIDVVVAQNDNMAFGAIEALKAAGKKPGSEVVIVSFDAVKAAFESMIAGDMNVSVECNPLHGPRVAELAKRILNDESVEKTNYVEEKVYPADTAEQELPNRQY